MRLRPNFKPSSALKDQAEAMGINAESIAEDAAQRTQDATQEDYYREAIAALKAAIARSVENGRVGTGKDGAVQGAGTEEVLTSPTRDQVVAQKALDNPVARATVMFPSKLKPTSSATRYQLRPEGLQKPNPTAPGYVGTYSPAPPYRALLAEPIQPIPLRPHFLIQILD